MKKFRTKSNHYDLCTDQELFGDLLRQLQEAGYVTLRELDERLRDLDLSSFTDLFNYTSGPDCDENIAIAVEEVADRLRLTEPKRDAIFTSSREAGNYLANKLIGRKQEEFWAIYLDNCNKIVAEKMISQGSLDRSLVHPRDVFRWAVVFNCSGIIVVHNHPSGKVYPSQNDIELTNGLNDAAKLMKVDLLDHFIVGQGHYLSMKENKLF